ncbi:TetR/AcrR family transcriptional regulator [Streptomyces sp. UNOB3_S3]|uniref:TetR/AcrR family transcriptional regulator n=1 Tax=Streptomyces sp. UNOB3_S3 TaxID=2871682 RepID=UPI001E484DF2|nr:TetR/AcrR family transcriptional regulator [Streptomyces sp. UNOB3_S3]MCC3775837.1 TetR/AcrR family transcriptional regulator [Streptomyces sp. UNOB3_S3]
MSQEPDTSLRERLIDAGVELVMTEGTAALGLREIARRAGVSHGAPRRYFPTHHSLLSAIARRGFADLGARVAATTEEATTPRARLDALARTYVGYALECRGMFELMFRHDLLDSEKNAPGGGGARLRESTLPMFGLFAGLVAHCRADEGTPPDVAAAALWANLHGVAQLWVSESLPLVLGTHAAGDTAGDAGSGRRLPAPLDALVTAVLDAHLGPVKP